MTTRHALLFMLQALVAAGCLFAASASLAREPSLIYPPDQVAVNQPEVRVIGLAPESEGTVSIQLKSAGGEQSFTVSVADGAFNQVVRLSPGLNTVLLHQGATPTSHAIFLVTRDSGRAPKGFKPLYLHSKSELTDACDQCHAPGPKGTDYTIIHQKLSCITASCHATIANKKYKHGPFQEGSCVECHNPHGTQNKKILKDRMPALCFSCHSEDEQMLNSGKVVHFPVKQGECTICHDPHQSDMAFHLKSKTIAELCGNCHSKSMITYQYMHEPFASGDCNACHSPHVSKFDHLLVADGSALCLECHKEREEEFTRRFVHEPVKKDCHLCHDPHGSDTKDHLITPRDKQGKYIHFKQPIKELCLSCHRKLNPEMAKLIEHGKVPHQPVAQGKCTVCHTPHSTNFKKQLNTSIKDACFQCHEALKKQIHESKFEHGPVRTDDCAQCHQVHGSDHQRLLRANFTENYSEDFDLKHYEICFNCHNSRVFLDKHSLETGFRNGTTNLHYLHVNRAKDGRSCKTCHDIHASNQPKHIRTTIPYKGKMTITLKYTKNDSGGGCVVGCHTPRKYDREKTTQP